MPTVSATLIVKDAADSIERCLRSFMGHVDQLVVLDTGSTDGTLDILEALQQDCPHLQIEHFTWVNDFAAARNAAMSFATCDWLFWVDADDVVVGGEGIRALVGAQPAEVSGIHLPYEYRDGVIFPRERLVRNDGSYTWKWPIHEALVTDHDEHGTHTIEHHEISVVHHRGDESNESNNDRNITIHRAYHARCAREGVVPDARSYFYFGNDLRNGGEHEEAIRRYWQAIGRSTWRDERYQAHHFIADCLRELGRPLEAIEVELLAIQVDPSWPDAYFGIAESFYAMFEYDAVLDWTAEGFRREKPNTMCVTSAHDYDYWPHVYLAWSRFQLGEYDLARESAKVVLALFPAWDMGHLVRWLDRAPRQRRASAS